MLLPVNGLYGHIARNNTKSILLLASFAALIAIYWLAVCLLFKAVFVPAAARHAQGDTLHVLGIIFAAAARSALATWYIPGIGLTLWFAAAFYWHQRMISLATGAEPLERRSAPKLYNMVESLAIAAGLPMPRIEVIETPELNAYAAGMFSDDTTVAVTRGLLDALEPEELEAVLAHEITHIKNRDVRLMVVALIFCSGLTFAGKSVEGYLRVRSGASNDLGWDILGLLVRHSGRKSNNDSASNASVALAVVVTALVAVVLLAFSHIAALLAHFAISRSREYMADAGAVELTKSPDALISALKKISANDAVPLSTESLRAMMISRACNAQGAMAGLFATHPSIERRIASLARFAGGDPGASIRPRGLRRPGLDGDAPRAQFGRRRKAA